jgi:hypothetical protein
LKKNENKFAGKQEGGIFAALKQREFSSAGSEHLPYKQRVTGSNPVTPTTREALLA